MFFISNHYHLGSKNSGCNTKGMENSKLKKYLEHYNSLTEEEKIRENQVTKFYSIASITRK